MDPNLILGPVEKFGILGLMSLIICALIYWIERRTVPKAAFDQQATYLEQMRSDMSKLVGPALDRFTVLQEKQLAAQEQMWHRLELHSEALASLSQDIKLISHELNMRRIEKPRERSEAEESE